MHIVRHTARSLLVPNVRPLSASDILGPSAFHGANGPLTVAVRTFELSGEIRHQPEADQHVGWGDVNSGGRWAHRHKP